MTLAVSETVTPGNYTLSYGDSMVRMANGHYQPTFEHNGTLVVTEASEGAADAVDDERDDATGDGAPGRFALGIATLAALGLLAALVARRRETKN